MRFDRIHIENFLSFDAFTWDRLDPTLNVLVGANGVGKTNLFHALRAVRTVVQRLSAPASLGGSTSLPSSLESWEQVRHRGDDTRDTLIAIDLALTTEAEQYLLATFMAASLLHPQEVQEVIARESQVNVDPAGLHKFGIWLERNITSATDWLLHGRLVISSPDDGHTWDCRYEARQQSAIPFWWDLRTPGIRARAEPTNASVPSLFVAWREQLVEEERHALDLALASQPGGRFPDTLDLQDLPVWANPAYAKPLGVQAWSWQGPAPHINQRLASLLPVEQPGTQATGSQVWNRLLEEAFVFTENVRLPPRTEYKADELDEALIDLSDGKDLALYLYRLSVGDGVKRKTYTQIQSLFQTLTGRTFEVVRPEQGASRKGQKPRGRTTTQNGVSAPAVDLVIEANWGDVPLKFSGAGIAEALYMSTLLAGSTGQVVVLDEPALNLHPTLMSSFLAQLLAHQRRPQEQRSQFLVSTHSPWLIPADALDRVARFTLGASGQTFLHSLHDPAGPPLDDAQRAELRNLVRKRPSAAALLFSRAVLLVEGETELGALPVWWWDIMQQDVTVYSVDGKGNFVGPVKFLNRFAIPWAIVCDGDALWDKTQQGRTHKPDLYVQAILKASGKRLRAGIGDPTTDVGFRLWRRRVERFGIFTLASSSDAAFEKAVQAETPWHVWDSAHERFDSNNVAVGRYVAENCDCPPSLEHLMRRIVQYLNLHGAGLRTLQRRATPRHR